MKSFSDYIKVNDSIEISDSGYSQNEIEEFLNKIEIISQDSLLNDDSSKKEKSNAVETIR